MQGLLGRIEDVEDTLAAVFKKSAAPSPAPPNQMIMAQLKKTQDDLGRQQASLTRVEKSIEVLLFFLLFYHL